MFFFLHFLKEIFYCKSPCSLTKFKLPLTPGWVGLKHGVFANPEKISEINPAAPAALVLGPLDVAGREDLLLDILQRL